MSSTSDFLSAIEFKSMDASNIIPLKMGRGLPTNAKQSILPICIDGKMHDATFQKHYKFSFVEKFVGKDKLKTYSMILACLRTFDEIPKDLLQGEKYIGKEGMLCFENEYDTTVRVWITQKVRSKLICEITVCGYKGVEKEKK